jgi:exoribonuclease II
MGPADYRYLTQHGLLADCVISRSEGDRTADDLLKLRGLKRYAAQRKISWRKFCKTSLMFDDNINVIFTLTNHGMVVHNALAINQRLSA